MLTSADRTPPEQEYLANHLGYWSAPRAQAIILLKIAAAARTYGLDLCSKALFIVFRLFLFENALSRRRFSFSSKCSVL